MVPSLYKVKPVPFHDVSRRQPGHELAEWAFQRNPCMPNQPYPHSRSSQPVLRACAIAAALLACASARAETAAGPTFNFRGFGTVGVVHSDYREADFVSSVFKGEGAGASRRWSYNVDSRLGAQADVKFDKKWSAVVQVGVEQRFDLSYRPMVEWANVKYQATPDLALRVGRIALPIFLAADYRKVGYAYPWVRTPQEVYGGAPITNSDGVDLAYRWQHAGVKHVTQASYGQTDIHLTDTTRFKARGIAGITHTTEYGAATVRVSFITAVLNVDIVRPLFDGFRQFGPPGIAIADNYDIVNKRFNIRAIGLNYDPGKWFFMAEGGTSNGHSFIAKARGMYASAGYRAGELTPYLVYSRTDSRSPGTDPGLSTAGLPPAYAFVAAQLNANLDTLLKTRASQTSMAAGVRWDARHDMALKLQYERVEPRNGSRGSLTNLTPNFVSGRPVHVTSAVLDFVF